jgi:protein-tyrosine phosphatase
MYDLHCHLLPGIDDGARDLETSLSMARAFVDQGVVCVACTPHILPGLYHNTGPDIRRSTAQLQAALTDAGIPLHLVPGADNHVTGDFVEGLRTGHLLTLGDSAYTLVEPPHHVPPARLEDFFFQLLMAGYSPILTHPERLTWIESKYDVFRSLVHSGVWMQVTSGSLTGRFGRRPKYWAEKMIGEGLVHILASDAHDTEARPPDLAEGRQAAERLVGAEEAYHLVVTRPYGVLLNKLRNELPTPPGTATLQEVRDDDASDKDAARGDDGGLARRLWRFVDRRSDRR